MEAVASSSNLCPAAMGLSSRLKLVLLGDHGVGKTSLVNRYVHECFSVLYERTTVDNHYTKEIEIDERPVTLDIWDTPGEERYQNLSIYYEWFDGLVLVFDVNSWPTFKSLHAWHSKIMELVTPSHRSKLPFMLIGNKIDMNLTHREVSRALSLRWCAVNENIPYFETSAKDNYNIDHAFHNIAKAALEAKTERDNILSQEFSLFIKMWE